MHILDWLIVAAAALALLGPKMLQSVAHNAGKTAGHAKDLKDKVMSDLSMDEFTEIKNSIPTVPTNPQQAMKMMLSSDAKKKNVEPSIQSGQEK
jgi:Sec-independent protein translocase protein TatA